MSWLSGLAKLLLRAGEQGAEREGAEGVLRQAARGAEHAGADMAVRDSAPLAVQRGGGWWDAPAQPALPPPPRRLALPAPPPSELPPHAVKPKGGQWWPNREIIDTNWSPEASAERIKPFGLKYASPGTPDAALAEWWSRALPKYIRNDLGTPDDPLLDLANRGLLHIPDLTAEQWANRVRSSLASDTVGDIMFPKNLQGGMPGAGNDLRGAAVAAMPWLPKLPVDTRIYGLPYAARDFEFGHVGDEMSNAMNFHGGALSDLAVRPESLQRMSFPQAVEHVGKINQRRAEIMAQQQAELSANPAVHLVKEYPDSPQGMRWVELKMPDPAERFDLTPAEENGNAFWHATDPETGEVFPLGGSREQALDSLRYHARQPLEDALRYEGDQMGHCVGGYCDDVASGRSRIFSLRDAKGAPHVTIETGPQDTWLSGEMLNDARPGAFNDYLGQRYAEGGIDDMYRWVATQPDLSDKFGFGKNNIVQIKGKQNRAPIEDYLPYVQDFVKTQGPWGHVGDLHNARMVNLPDGRFITEAQLGEIQHSPAAMALFNNDADAAAKSLSAWNLRTFSPEDWDQTQHLFEGYAYGGRVEPHRDFARNPMAVF